MTNFSAQKHSENDETTRNTSNVIYKGTWSSSKTSSWEIPILS